MSLELARAYIRMVVDGSGMRSGFAAVQSAASTTINGIQARLSEVFNIVESKSSDSINGVQSLVTSVLGGMGIYGLVADASRMMSEAQAKVTAEKRLEASWVATKNAIGMSIAELHKWAEATELATNFDSTEIMDSMSSMLTYTALTKDQMEKVLETAMDVTAQYGGSLKMSMQSIAKMLSNPLDSHVGLGQLGRQGYYITPQQREEMKQMREAGDEEGARGILMQVLSGQEGAARRIAGPVTELKKLKQELSNVREAVGKNMIPLMKQWEYATIGLQIAKAKLIGGLIWVADILLKINAGFGGLPLYIAGAIASVLAMAAAIHALNAAIGMTAVSLAGLWKFFAGNPVGMWMLAIAGAAAGIAYLIGGLTTGKSEPESPEIGPKMPYDLRKYTVVDDSVDRATMMRRLADSEKPYLVDQKEFYRMYRENMKTKNLNGPDATRPTLSGRRSGFLELGQSVQDSLLGKKDDIPKKQLLEQERTTTEVGKVKTAVEELTKKVKGGGLG